MDKSIGHIFSEGGIQQDNLVRMQDDILRKVAAAAYKGQNKLTAREYVRMTASLEAIKIGVPTEHILKMVDHVEFLVFGPK